jgi:hypothetical protein
LGEIFLKLRRLENKNQQGIFLNKNISEKKYSCHILSFDILYLEGKIGK